MTTYHHPNLTRALYIDRHNYVDDFLTRLSAFLVNLRNRGIDDEQLLRHISDVLYGSLMNGVEHSTIYGERKIYTYVVGGGGG